jgi:cysteine-rich repeat protein
VVNPGELCDDGNATNGEGCDASCTPTACGNGILTCRELCDDGNVVNGDDCDANCTRSACGNGVAAGAETCDDGNTVNGDGCDADCTPTGCGNGVITGSERCDDGNTVSGDGCDANCTRSACGNGVAAGAETCDDGNTVSGDGCDADCTPTGCGNRIVTAGETCDDGNSDAADGCDACRLLDDEQEPNEDFAHVQVLTGSIFGFLSTRADSDMFAVDVTEVGTALGIEIGRADGQPCQEYAHMEVVMYDPDQHLIGSFGGKLGPSCTINAHLVTRPGRYYMQLRYFTDQGSAPPAFHYHLNLIDAVPRCGNDVRERGEACDDGNLVDGDGCSSTCGAEAFFDESEPNDDGTTARNQLDFSAANADGPIQSTTLVRGAIGLPSGDEDVYRIENTADVPRHVRVRAYGFASDTVCIVATAMFLRNEQGQVLASSFGCAAVELDLPAHGSVYLHVADDFDNAPLYYGGTPTGGYAAFVELR